MKLDTQQLVKKKEELEKKFADIKAKAVQIEKAMSDGREQYGKLLEEMTRLQGAWKAIDELLGGKGKKAPQK